MSGGGIGGRLDASVVFVCGANKGTLLFWIVAVTNALLLLLVVDDSLTMGIADKVSSWYYIPPVGRTQDAFKGLDGGVDILGLRAGQLLELDVE